MLARNNAAVPTQEQISVKVKECREGGGKFNTKHFSSRRRIIFVIRPPSYINNKIIVAAATTTVAAQPETSTAITNQYFNH
jgi:hypothetical protein